MERRLFILGLIISLSYSLPNGQGKTTDDRDLSGDIAKENTLVEDSLHRVKRTSFNITQFIWPNHIPYVIGFKGAERRDQLRLALDFLEDHLCVKFVNVEGRLDKSKPNSLTDLGFKTNAYIFFISRGGCWGVYGQGGSRRGPRNVSPCYDFFSMVHETLHSLGGHHAQKHPKRDKYITVHDFNVYPGKRKNYARTPTARVNYKYFDPKSILMYGNQYFGMSGPTYDFVRPDMKELFGMGSIKTLMYEMTQNYKCAQRYCSDISKDCGQGYLTYLRNECVCVCPDKYDPKTDCTTLIEKVEGPSSWPNTSFTLYKATSQCPDGFEEGTIPLPGKMVPQQTGRPLPVEGKTLKITVCTRKTPTENNIWGEWPSGKYCIGKVVQVQCKFPFKESTFKMKTTSFKVRVLGSVGDAKTEGRFVIMKLCCIDQGPTGIPIKLPTTEPFRLIHASGSCQAVEGMYVEANTIKTQTKTTISGFKPTNSISGNYFTHTSCVYIPPVYGCNKIFTLTADLRKVTFSTPTKGSLREGSRRCFFAFKAPKESRLRLSFDKFSIHPGDKFYVKRFHPWTNPYRVLAGSSPTQMITESNYLFVEFWSHYKEDTKYSGADLTVDLLLDTDLCYTAKTQGADYVGDKNITELYEDCVAWKDATSCPDFPWKYSATLFNSGNKCRNLDDLDMLQPWCYSYVDGTECIRRYCDVCNEMQSKDVEIGCQKKIAANPDLCLEPFFKNSCFKSCGASTQIYDKNMVKCAKPRIPSQVSMQENLVETYPVGSTLSMTCGQQTSKIECRTHGWTPFHNRCTGSCNDAIQTCSETLINFPKFCTHVKTRELAQKQCKKSCGFCQAGKCSVSGGGTYSLVSPKGGQVTTGQTATFVCQDHLSLVSGDLTRACSITGNLLGETPKCEAKKYPVDINIKFLRQRYRTDTFKIRMALLLLSEQHRVPFDGKITRWFFYCRNNDGITLLVYRETDQGSIYELVGSNPANCEKGHASTHFVPADQQLSVKKGDIIGVHQPTGSFGWSRCGNNKSLVALTRKIDVRALLSTKKTSFTKRKTCLAISLGARVEPMP